MSRSALLLVLVALVVGAAVGYVAGVAGRTPSSAPAPPSDPPSPPASGDTRTGSPAPDNPGVVGVDIDPLPPGDGEITGRVTRENGSPVTGVVVRATPSVPGRRDRPGREPREEAPDTLVRRYSARIRFERDSRRQAITDGAGRFRLDGISDVGYRVEAFLAGHTLRKSGGRGGMARAGDVVNFVASRVVEVSVSVLLPGGKSAERAVIECSRARSANDFSPVERKTWRAGDPVLYLGPGAWTLTAVGGPREIYRSEDLDVEVTDGAASEPVVLRLGNRPGIRGRLTFPAGHPGLTARIYALRVAPGAEVADRRVVEEGEAAWLGEDTRSDYAFDGIEPGNWILVATMGRNRVVSRERIEVVDRVVIRDFALPPPEPGDYLILRVEGPDGKPLSDVAITTGYESGSLGSFGGGDSTVLPDGTIRVQHHDVEPGHLEDDGEYIVQVRSEKYGSKEIRYDPDETQRLTVRFDDPALLTVRMTGYVESGTGASVRITLSKEGASLAQSGEELTPDAEGVVRFAPVPPGEYSLQVGVLDGPWARTVKSVPLTLSPGRRQETVAFPPLYSLTVTTGASAENEKVGLRSQGGPMSTYLSPRHPEDGRVVFDGLPEGRYLLFGGESGPAGEMAIHLTRTTTVRFESQTMNALRVDIREEAGGLFRAGLRQDDLILAIDGNEIEDAAQGRSLIKQASSRRAAKLTVRRGSAQIELTIDLGAAMHDRPGGAFYPHPR